VKMQFKVILPAVFLAVFTFTNAASADEANQSENIANCAKGAAATSLVFSPVTIIYSARNGTRAGLTAAAAVAATGCGLTAYAASADEVREAPPQRDLLSSEQNNEE
jgi:FtsH-binding integral membrane protein